jgi:hypothetical protein
VNSQPAERSEAEPHRRQAFPAEFPEGLKPRLRLFLSADLEGSTPYKQARKVWRPEIIGFYRDFDYILQSQFRAFAGTRDEALPAPEFWKSNGDELLYVCELRSLSHAHALMHVWAATLDEYQSSREEASKHLEVKSTAWIGLFPAPNAELFFRRGPASAGADDPKDPVLAQATLRDEWYSGPSPTISRDFVGPSIDTGFRLTSWATPRRLIVSVDLAYLLTSSYTRGVGPLRLQLSGRAKLKGVIDDQPYPVIWAPVSRRGVVELDPRRDGRTASDRATIRCACEAVIEQHYTSITPFFLGTARFEEFDWVPPYMLRRILGLWQDEARYRTELTNVVLI